MEGHKEIEMALEGGCLFKMIFYVEELADMKLIRDIMIKNREAELFEINKDLFAKTAYRESTGGIIACIDSPVSGLNDLNLPANPLILIIDGVEKPGNLGAMLRTADAASVDAVICSNLPGDLYNPNTIRASLGTIFTVKVCAANGEELRNWLKENKIKTFCTNLHEAIDYLDADYRGPSAIVMGTEAHGIGKEWIEFADKNVKIPMQGKIDSMNVSVAAALMVFEAKRQRRF